MKLSDKIQYLREVEGSLRGLGRAMTQQEVVRALAEEAGGQRISQSYLSQIESGTRPHLTNTTRLLLARFFKVHPGYLVEDPEDFQAEFRTAELAQALDEDRLDLWLIAGAERFGRSDPKLCRALLALAEHPDSRGCLLLLEAMLRTPVLASRLMEVLQPLPAKGAAHAGVRASGTTLEQGSVPLKSDGAGAEHRAAVKSGVVRAARKGSRRLPKEKL